MNSDPANTRSFEESWDERKDRLCDEFEDAWRTGQRPKIEDYLRDLVGQVRSELLGNLLDVELELRRGQGEEPSAEEYERRFPNDVALVRAAFCRDGCLPPEWIDRFKVIRSLGGGGFGQVYLCSDDKLRRNVAIKVPRRDRLSTVQARELFLSEARNVAGLHHDAIVTLHDFGEFDGQCYLVYEYIAGSNLAERLKQARLPQDQVARIIGQIAEALHYAHGEDVYHRDIKPANILLDGRQHPYLTDFGLAVRVQNLPGERGRLAGTAHYMAPEQVRGEGDQIDGRADIYSLGVVLYELLTGRRPFDGRKRQDVYDQILSSREPRPPCEISHDIHPDLQDICLKAMAKSVTARYLTAGDMAQRLHKVAMLLAQPQLPATQVMPLDDQGQPPEPSSIPPPAPVIPKGLRSFGPEDKAFFLELLPGPRDRNRLPESIRFWKIRVESADTEVAFAVGLIYGPSGCGKSSLVKAGLLPQLAPTVVPVYVEAARENTEDRLLAQLRKKCPGPGGRASLRTTVARLRQSRGLPEGSKLLIVLDQFEQWLHAHTHDMESSELVAALRQADGEHVQVILMVRSDFWMSTTRLFESLKTNLDRARNTRAVDLFGEGHAHHVLHLFGTAYDKLPPDRADFTKDQVEFLELAVKDLSTDGDIIPVHLSLFADMMKNRPWTREEFLRVGRTKGLGKRFLEDIFTQPDLKGRKGAAQAMLQKMLPAAGADIKGPMRSRKDLTAAAELSEESHAFAQLIESLIREYIITPVDVPAQMCSSMSGSDNGTEAIQPSYYQLTHDFLVPSLREWITQEKQKSWKGRAELRLQDRSDMWNAQPQNRFLPAAWEFVDILLFTRRRTWTPEQGRMMRKATRYHAFRTCALMVLVILVCWGAFELNGSVRAHTRATELVSAGIGEVPAKIKELKPYRRWADPQLSELAHDQTCDPKKRRNAYLALLSTDPDAADFLTERLLTGEVEEVRVLGRVLLERQGPSTADALWEVLESQNADADRRLRAASALAAHDPGDPRWDKISWALVDKLLTEFLAGWGKEFEPIGEHFVQPLIKVLEEPNRSETDRSVAARYLADYARNLPGTLAELVKSVDTRYAAILLPSLLEHRSEAIGSMDLELEQTLVPDWKDQPIDLAWSKPSRALVDKLDTAHGIITDRFAFCQTLPLDDFLAMGDALRSRGYRPTCFRPCRVSEAIQVAAVWTRDGRNWQLAYDLSASELRRQDSKLRQTGLLPVDIAVYLSGESERYAALWGMPDRETADAKLGLELSEDAFAAAWQRMQKAGFMPRTQILSHVSGRPAFASTSNETRNLHDRREGMVRSVIWYKPRNASDNVFFDSGKDQSWYECHLTPSELLTDVRVGSNATRVWRRETELESRHTGDAEPESGDIRHRGLSYSAIWHSSADLLSAESHNLDPVGHLDRCRQLMNEGYRPVSISVASLKNALLDSLDPHPSPPDPRVPFSTSDSGHRSSPSALLTASVWHRPFVPEAAKDVLAKRQARAVVALLRLDQPDRFWRLLRFRPDPSVRTYVIHTLRPFGIDAEVLVRRLRLERDVSAKRAIVLALGEYLPDSLADSTRNQFIEEMRQAHQDDPDPGMHSSIEWLLRSWGEEDLLKQAEKKLVSRRRVSDRRWYVNGEGQTMVTIPRPGEFWMGSPGSEPGRVAQEEAMRRTRIPYSYAIASKEVTTEQFRHFLDANPKIRDRFSRNYGQDQEPIGHVTWVEAVEYCRWLSEKEQVSQKEMCYPRLGEISAGMPMEKGFLGRIGYRLPTEEEWEYACRAGSITSRYFGGAPEMLVKYAWHSRNSDLHAWPVGQLKPNDFGLFDMYGNIGEWCQYRLPTSGSRSSQRLLGIDKDGVSGALDNPECGWRGGSFWALASRHRSAATSEVTWTTRMPTLGFRVARTQRTSSDSRAVFHEFSK
jgi:serine/threonine protein kinase/formylglycine-generating enzyme required for sulfatase activity